MVKKVKVKSIADFVRETRMIEVGDELDVQHVSNYTDKDGKKKTHYLVEGKNGKPISLLEEEVDVLN